MYDDEVRPIHVNASSIPSSESSKSGRSGFNLFKSSSKITNSYSVTNLTNTNRQQTPATSSPNLASELLNDPSDNNNSGIYESRDIGKVNETNVKSSNQLYSSSPIIKSKSTSTIAVNESSNTTNNGSSKLLNSIKKERTSTNLSIKSIDSSTSRRAHKHQADYKSSRPKSSGTMPFQWSSTEDTTIQFF
ncbi:hypothetical protein BLOT_001181 [Blomia tropicalis]|nr:hypothetical protein BLOT_001181 [Blomia tropicalis]